ncbi:MAG TPA: glycine--tRNA ligase [Candidatus Saccharimonadales bacterium]|nr:glycine--tRNA ligase [Candidatus Saccharimonadales bacterium]
MSEVKMDDIISLAKRRGFVYPGSEIYGGQAGMYDYGPLGVELLNNLKAAWWKAHVYERDDFYGLDSAIFKDPRVWDASGHTSGFSDPLAECKKCNTRIRVDKELEKIGVTADEKMSEAELERLFDENRDKLKCPKCSAADFGPVRMFNLLVKTNMGDFTGEMAEPVYLPGEACQGIYLNFKNVVDTTPAKIPFGIAQIGKAFRNEISPRNFLFRTRELEQADTQYFVKPHENKDEYERIKQRRMDWYTQVLGVRPEKLRLKQHENLVFYAADAWDIEYDFPTYGFDEIEGIHDRTDYDLTQHAKFSGTDLSYVDPMTQEKYIPWILETSVGMGRMLLTVLSDAYHEEEINGDKRVVLKLKPELAPVKVAVSPLLKNKPELVAKAREVYTMLKKEFGAVMWDDNGNIGKRYRRQDEIGTPYCIVIDFDTLEGDTAGTVTVRNRDTTQQERVKIEELVGRLRAS